MEGGEQTTISPEFLENIQSAVNSQGVLGQVQVIETENGPVTVLFMEEGADTSHLGGENITFSVGEAGQSFGETVVEDPNAEVQYQYHVQTEEDYSQLLQGDVGDTVVSVADTGKDDLAAAVQPVINLPAADQATTETYEQPVGDTTTDTYYITDTGEILKIDSSLLGENAGDATLQLQTQDGTLQILNQVGNVQTSQVDTQLTYPQSAVDNINITYDQGTPFEYTATKVDNPLVIDTARVEEPKVLSYKTTNRQRTNIMRQPVSKSTPANIKPRPAVTSQTVMSQTSLLSPQYKTVKQRDLIGTTTEVVYPQPYQKQTIVFPKVQKQTPYTNVIKTGQQSYQTKLKTAPQQMITTVMKPQSLLKPNLNQALTSGTVVNKLNASQIPAGKVTAPSTYTQKQVPALNKLPSQVVSTQVPAATKQTDLLSVAMKQAEVPQQVLSSTSAMNKIESTPVVVNPVMASPRIEKPVSGDVSKSIIQESVSSEPVKEITQISLPSTTELPVVPEKQQTSEQQVTISPTVEEEMVDNQENSIDSQNDDLSESKMETDEQPAEEDQSVIDQKADDSKTTNTENLVSDSSTKQVAINRFSETDGQVYKENSDVNDEKDKNRDVEIVKVVKWDENFGLVEEKVCSSSGSNPLGSENDANKFGANVDNRKETAVVQASIKSFDRREEDTEKSFKKDTKEKEKKVKNNVTEKVAFTKKVHNVPIRRVLKCEKCPFTTGKKSKLQHHMFEQHKIGPPPDKPKSPQSLFKQQQVGCSPDKPKLLHQLVKKQEISCSTKKSELQQNKTTYIKCKICSEDIASTTYSKHVFELHQPKKFECGKCKEVFWSEESRQKHTRESFCKSVDISRVENGAPEEVQESHVSKNNIEQNDPEISGESVEMVNHDDDSDSVKIIDVGTESDDNVVEISDCETDNELEKDQNVKFASKDHNDTAEITEWPRVVLERLDVDEVVESTFSEYSDKRYKSQYTYTTQLNEYDVKIKSSSSSSSKYSRSSDKRSCIFCKKIFVGSKSLNRHLRKVHTGPFKCYRCKSTFRKKKEYREHLKFHKANKYKCIRCAKSFPNWRQQQLHMSTKHFEKRYLCELCGRKMALKSQYFVHMKLHQGIYPFRCPQCDFGFLKEYILEKHKKTCGTEAETRYLSKILNYRDKTSLFERKKVVGHHKCCLCNKSFLSNRGLKTHKRTGHGILPKKKVPQSIAGYRKLIVSRLSESDKMSLSFKKNRFSAINFPIEETDGLNDEVDQDSNENQDNEAEASVNINELRRVYQCNFCTQCFHDFIALILHVDVHKTVCSVCNQRLQNYTALKQHRIFGHTNNDTQGMKCAKCDRRFNNRNDLIDHMTEHIGPWFCEKKGCGFRFSDKNDLRKHRRTHTSGSIVCVCQRRYKTKVHMMKHIKKKKGKCLPLEWPDGGIICMNENVVNKVQPAEDIPLSSVESFIKKGKDVVVEGKGTIRGPFTCRKCKARFVSRSLTKRHILLRHCKNRKERTYHCNLCDFKTHNSDVMKTHQKDHIGNLKCEFCPSSFEDETNLERHIQYHLKDKYQCFYCSKMFANRPVCRNHILTYHGKGKQDKVLPTVKENVPEGNALVVNRQTEKDFEYNGITFYAIQFDKKVASGDRELGEGSDNGRELCKGSDNGRELCEVPANEDTDSANENIEGMNENDEEDTGSPDENVETKLDKSIEKGHSLVSEEQKSGTSGVSEIMNEDTETENEKQDEIEKTVPISVPSPSINKPVTDGEIVDQILLSDATISDRTELNPLVETHPPSPGMTYDNLVDQIGTILTDEVWDTAQFEDEEEQSYNLISKEVEPINKFDEYKGLVPVGLELYIPLVEPYKCGGCNILCDGELNFKKHTITLHTEGSRCKICSKKSTTQKILNAHMIDKHLVGTPLTCPECKAVFKKTNTYWRHAKVHAKCFICEICDQGFSRKMYLAEHMKTHVESKEFCIKCGKMFDTHELLRIHSWKEHRTKMNKKRPPVPPRVGKKRKYIGKIDLTKKNEAAAVKDVGKHVGDVGTSSKETDSSGQLAQSSPAAQTSSEMKSIDVPDSDVTIQLFADGTLVTRDKAGTNYSQVKLEDLGLDLSMLEGNTDIELLIVQGDGKEVRATINTSKHVNPTTESVTPVSKSASATTVSSIASETKSTASAATSTERASAAPVNEARPYKCSMCPRTFKFYRTFRCHEIVHTKAVTFTCHLCQRLFAREVNLQSHLELHKKKGAMKPIEERNEGKGEETNYQCEQCQKTFTAQKGLIRHIKEQHEERPRVPCPICGKLFKSESNVQRHSKIHIGPFTCPHCIKVYTDKLEYHEHIKAEHPDLMFVCQECDAILPSKKAFVTHVKQHSNPQELIEGSKDKNCKVCNKKFDKRSELDSHMVIHSAEKNQECPACHKKYKLLHTLERHIKEVHNNDVVFACSECDDEFDVKSKLDLHVKLFHTGNYQCLTCYEEFPERSLLEEHQFQNHDFALVCSKCQSKFETSIKLKNHLKEHTSQNSLCDICGAGFEHKAQLRSHLINKHFGRDRTSMLKQYPGMSNINVEIVCDLCGEFYHNKPLYKQHLRDVHFGGDTVAMLKLYPYFLKVTDPPEPVTCDHCGKTCSSMTQLNFHLKTHVKSKFKKPVQKEEFNLTDDEQDDPVDFTNIEPRELDKNYSCKKCGAQFSRKAALEKHMSVHKKDELKEALKDIEKEEIARAELEEKEGWKPTPPKSKKTGKESLGSKPKETKSVNKTPATTKIKLPFPKTVEKKKNESSDTGLSPKRRSSQLHICKVCEEIFKTSEELTVHMHDDHGDLDFKVETNSSSGITKYTDKDIGHEKTVEFDLTTFKCLSCDKMYSSRKNLRKHLRNVHRYKEKSSSSSENFKCTECEMVFNLRSNMDRHMYAKHGVQIPSSVNESPTKIPSNKKKTKGTADSDDNFEPMEYDNDDHTDGNSADITAFLGKNFNLAKAHSCNIESVKKKQHRCNLCGEGFSRDATLKKHLAFHDTGIDPDIKPDIDDFSDLQPAIYTCKTCGSMYSTALGLIHHNRSKHSEVDEEVVLAEISEVDAMLKLESPKKKFEKELSKPSKRKLESDAEDVRENAKKRLKLDKDGKVSYDCKFCGAVYFTYKGLMKHEQDIHDANKVMSPQSALRYSHSGRLITKSKKLSEQIQCDKCTKVFQEERGLKQHIMKVHKVEEAEKAKPTSKTQGKVNLVKTSVAFKCDQCTKEFDLRINLRRHMKMKHNIELPSDTLNTSLHDSPVKTKLIKSPCKFKCDLCPKEFDLRINLRRHAKLKHNIELPPDVPSSSPKGSPQMVNLVYHCDVCEQKFSTLASLRHHMISVHDENDVEVKTEAVICEICNLEFATQKSLEVHMRKHTGEKPYRCCLCNKQFISKYQLECHMKKLHSKLWAKKVKCKICLMLFETEKAMLKHKVIHRKPQTLEDLKNKSEPDQHKCNYCEKAFKWKRNLVSHVEIYHKDSDPQTCGVCNKVFPDKESIKAHMSEHQVKKESHTCKVCDKSFQKESSLKMHEAQLHKPKSTPGGGMSCDICKESFSTKIKLLEHMLSHTSVMPHKCDLCSASFKQEFRLKAHKLTHRIKDKKSVEKNDADKGKGQDLKGKEIDKSKKEIKPVKYKCKKCSKKFDKAWLLRSHTVKSHKQKFVVTSSLLKGRVTRSRSLSETKTDSAKQVPTKEKRQVPTKEKKQVVPSKEKKPVVPIKEKKQVVPTKEKKQAVPIVSTKEKKQVVSAKEKKQVVPTKEKKLLKEKKLMKKELKKVQSSFCKKCNLNFIKMETYELHMKTVHKIAKKSDSPKVAKGDQSKKPEKKAQPKSEGNAVKSKKLDKTVAKKNNAPAVKGNKEMVGHDCPICKKIFSKRFTLKSHIKNMHKVMMEDSPSKIEIKRKKCLYCTECARVFWSQMQYDTHNKRFHPDKSALELDKQVMQALGSGEIKTEPLDAMSSPKQTEFETIQHKCEFCPMVHWTKKLFDEHMLKEHPEHASEYGITGEDTSRPTIEFVNDSEDMMGNLLSVGLYDVSACDKLSSLPVVSIQRINGKHGYLISQNNDQLPETEEQSSNNESKNTGIDARKTSSMNETADVGCVISNIEGGNSIENDDMSESDTEDSYQNIADGDDYSREYEKFLQNSVIDCEDTDYLDTEDDSKDKSVTEEETEECNNKDKPVTEKGTEECNKNKPVTEDDEDVTAVKETEEIACTENDCDKDDTLRTDQNEKSIEETLREKDLGPNDTTDKMTEVIQPINAEDKPEEHILENSPENNADQNVENQDVVMHGNTVVATSSSIEETPLEDETDVKEVQLPINAEDKPEEHNLENSPENNAEQNVENQDVDMHGNTVVDTSSLVEETPLEDETDVKEVQLPSKALDKPEEHNLENSPESNAEQNVETQDVDMHDNSIVVTNSSVEETPLEDETNVKEVRLSDVEKEKDQSSEIENEITEESENEKEQEGIDWEAIDNEIEAVVEDENDDLTESVEVNEEETERDYGIGHIDTDQETTILKKDIFSSHPDNETEGIVESPSHSAEIHSEDKNDTEEIAVGMEDTIIEKNEVEKDYELMQEMSFNEPENEHVEQKGIDSLGDMDETDTTNNVDINEQTIETFQTSVSENTEVNEISGDSRNKETIDRLDDDDKFVVDEINYTTVEGETGDIESQDIYEEMDTS